MVKNLFLFFEGLAENVIDSQVLIHCKKMKEIGVEFEIWAFACNDELYQSSLKRIEYVQKLSGSVVKVFRGVRPAYPFSERINAYLVKKYIKKYNLNFEYIHARTDYSSAVASYVTDDFIWDCRGDTLAEFETDYRNSKNVLGKFYKRMKINNTIQRSKKAHKALFVSNFLKQKHQFVKESYVIGCTADETLFFYDERVREEKRKELGLNNDDKILIYSGGMAHYQMFPQTVDFFKGLGIDWKLLVITTGIDIARHYLEGIPKERYILKSAKFEEVNGYLNAADVGIMLREKNDLNRAASPTKFAEYSMAGLPIVYSDDVGDLTIYDQSLGNRVKKEDLSNFEYNKDFRINVSNATKNILSKRIVLDTYKNLYGV